MQTLNPRSTTDNPISLSRRAFLGLQGLALASVLSSCASAAASEPTPPPAGVLRNPDDIRAEGHVRIGICSDRPPFSYLTNTGVYEGLDVIFGRYLDWHIRAAAQFVAIDPDERFDVLASGEVDVVLAGMSAADERVDEIWLCNPLYQSKLALVTPVDVSFGSMEALVGGPLIVCTGTYAQQYARTTYPTLELKECTTLSDCYTALGRGAGVAVLDDGLCAEAWARAKKEFHLDAKGIGAARSIAPAVAAGQDRVQLAVSQMVYKFLSRNYAKKACRSYVAPKTGKNHYEILEKPIDVGE